MRATANEMRMGPWEQTSKQLKLHWLKAGVVSVEQEVRQLRIREKSASEPLMRCAKLRATSKIVVIVTN